MDCLDARSNRGRLSLTWTLGTLLASPGCWCTCVLPRQCAQGRWTWLAGRGLGCPGYSWETLAIWWSWVWTYWSGYPVKYITTTWVRTVEDQIRPHNVVVMDDHSTFNRWMSYGILCGPCCPLYRRWLKTHISCRIADRKYSETVLFCSSHA